MFDIFNKPSLVKLKDFSTLYEVDIQTEFSNSQDKESVCLGSKAKARITQSIINSKILNTYELLDIEGIAENEQLKEVINTNLAISKIYRQICFERDLSGKIKSITNKDQIKSDWKRWKEKELYNYLPKLEEQEKFVEIFEAGLSELGGNIKNELQYITLFPECYHFRDYISPYSKEFTGLYVYDSKFIKEGKLKYKFSPVKVIISNDNIRLHLISVVTNQFEIDSIINDLKTKGANFNNYVFNITLKLDLKMETGQLISSNLLLEEIVNNVLKFKNTVNVKELNAGI